MKNFFRIGILLGGLALVTVLTYLGAAVVYVLGAGMSRNVAVEGVTVAYVRNEANLRSCPSMGCPVLATMRKNQQLEVVDHANGQQVDGEIGWTIVRYGREEAYVSDLLITPDESIDFHYKLWATVSMLSLVTLATLSAGARMQFIGRIVRRFNHGANITLPLLVFAVGVLIGVVGFAYGELSGGSVESFLSDSFVNLGAGFIGSAVTFVLFQSLFSSLSLEQGEIRTAVASLEVSRKDLKGQQTTPLRGSRRRAGPARARRPVPASRVAGIRRRRSSR